MKISFFLPIMFFVGFSCIANETNREISRYASTTTSSSSTFQVNNFSKLKPYTSKVLRIENVLVNGNKVILSKGKFDSIYKEIDSTKTDLWECGSPFEHLDDDWMTKTYGKKSKIDGTYEKFDGKITTISGKGFKFTTNNHIVLFDTASAENNSFEIVSHKIKLNKNTTLKEFKKIFPNAEMEKLENENEVRFRFLIDKKTADAFFFQFKDGKLDSFSLWWELC